MTLVPEGRHVFPDLTVLENLKIGAYLRKDDLTDDLEWVYELFPTPEGALLAGGRARSPAASSRCWLSAAR